MSSEPPQQEQAVRYVEALRERFETQGMLAELQEYPNFVVWLYRVVDGQRKKPPFNPNTHQPASPIEPSTWGSLETALTALATGQFQGIGFMLSRTPFGGLDLDHSVEGGSLLPWAKDIVEAMDTYGEYSPSWNKTTGEGEYTYFLKENQRQVRKLAILKSTEKSTILLSPQTTCQEHRQLFTAGRQR